MSPEGAPENAVVPTLAEGVVIHQHCVVAGRLRKVAGVIRVEIVVGVARFRDHAGAERRDLKTALIMVLVVQPRTGAQRYHCRVRLPPAAQDGAAALVENSRKRSAAARLRRVRTAEEVQRAGRSLLFGALVERAQRRDAAELGAEGEAVQG